MDTQPYEQGAAAERPNAAPRATTPRPVRVGTIVWGGILALVAGLTFASVFLDAPQYTPSLWIWGVIGVGTLLVLAGIVGAIIRGATGRARRRGEQEL